MTIGRPFRTIVETTLQLLVGLGYHILHLAAPAGTETLAINHIPIIAHLEDVGAFKHTVPDHTDTSYMLPVL